MDASEHAAVLPASMSDEMAEIEPAIRPSAVEGTSDLLVPADFD